jgi:hypothetical protein
MQSTKAFSAFYFVSVKLDVHMCIKIKVISQERERGAELVEKLLAVKLKKKIRNENVSMKMMLRFTYFGIQDNNMPINHFGN